MHQRGRATFLFLCTLVCMSGISVVAQSTTSIQGTVSDPTGAIIPGVNVTIEDKGTGATRSALTNDTGRYQILQVSPGLYRLRAELTGFKTIIQDNLRLLVNTPTTLNLKFEVGQMNESVEVLVAATVINTVDATIGNTIQNSQITSLPLE